MNFRAGLAQLPRVYYGFAAGLLVMGLPGPWWLRAVLGYLVLVALRIFFPEPQF